MNTTNQAKNGTDKQAFDEKMRKIRAYYQRLKATNYPIADHPLESAEEYQKKLYLRMLAVIAAYHPETPQEQTLLLQRLIEGIGIPESIEELMRQAMAIETEGVGEFLEIFQTMDWECNFVLDAMVMIGVGGEVDEKQIELLAELMELLYIEKKEVVYLSKLAVSILEQDSEAYVRLHRERPESIDLTNFFCYTKEYVCGLLLDTEDVQYYFSYEPMSVNFKMGSETIYKGRRLIFENLIIDVKEDWHFGSCEQLKFIDCRLTGGGEGRLYIEVVSELSLEGCTVENFENRFAYIEKGEYLDVCENTFKNCGYLCDGDEVGGIFYWGSYNEQMKFSQNKFIDCYIKAMTRRYNYGVTSVIIGGNSIGSLELIGNRFINCQCINNGNYEESLFGYSKKADSFVEKDNVFSNSIENIFGR